MTDKTMDEAQVEEASIREGQAAPAAPPLTSMTTTQAAAAQEAGTSKRRRNADDTKELDEIEEQHVVLIREKDAKGHVSREDTLTVCLSKIAKASQLHLSDDRLTVTGQKGFR